jgi:hypothetical protein
MRAFFYTTDFIYDHSAVCREIHFTKEIYRILLLYYYHKKVKESRNRTGVAQRVPGGLGSYETFSACRNLLTMYIA